jgi:hypothetical protein
VSHVERLSFVSNPWQMSLIIFVSDCRSGCDGVLLMRFVRDSSGESNIFAPPEVFCITTEVKECI